MTRAEVAAVLASADPQWLRKDAGITIRTVAEALGCDQSEVWRWETGRHVPKGRKGFAYVRFIAALIRHESVTWDVAGGWWLDTREAA